MSGGMAVLVSNSGWEGANDTDGFSFPETRVVCISLAYLAEKSMDGRTGDGVGDGYKKV